MTSDIDRESVTRCRPCLWVLAVLIALPGISSAQTRPPPPPVVQIPGRQAQDRPQRPTAVQPEAVRVEGTAPEQALSPTPAPSIDPLGGSVPVGTIVAWVKSMTNTPALPSNWAPCNGQVVNDEQSPYFGMQLPDLNGVDGESRFLRGAAESGGVGGAVTHTHGGYRSQKYGSQRIPVGAPAPTEHLPPYYGVVWIIRVR